MFYMIQYYVSFLQMQNKNIVIFMRGAGTYYCNGVSFHFNVENVFDTQVNCVRGFVTEQTILPTSQSTTVLLKMSIGYLDLFGLVILLVTIWGQRWSRLAWSGETNPACCHC